MKKFILKLELHDEKEKRKALKTVSSLPGIDSISIDMKEKKLTIIGTVDPVSVVSKLRKFWPTHMMLVGPAKEPEKKEEAKKEEAKKEEPKKEEEGKKEEPKKEEEKKEVVETKAEKPKNEEEKKKENEAAIEIMPYKPYYPPANAMPYRPYYPQMNAMPYRPYNPPMNTYYHSTNYSMEENPNACVIC